jgi:hypothetical protein
MKASAEERASLQCEIPTSEIAVALCAAVRSGLEAAPGNYGYTLVVEEATQRSIKARLDHGIRRGPDLKFVISDSASLPKPLLAKFAADLIASQKP